MASEKEKELFGDLVYAAMLDGDLSAEDEERLLGFGRQLGLTAEECSDIMPRAGYEPGRRIRRPEDRAVRETMFVHFIRFAMVDGYIDANERSFLTRVAKQYGFSKIELGGLIQRAHSAGAAAPPPPPPPKRSGGWRPASGAVEQ